MDQRLIGAMERILEPFVGEALPDGGIDVARSRWQKPGRGFGPVFPGGPDVRYLRFLMEVLYRMKELTGNETYHRVADAHARFMARVIHEAHQTWAMGNALEMIGLYHRYNQPDANLIEATRRIVNWARRRKVRTSIGELSYDHFPCGYGTDNVKDAGWTNDLSMFGSGLVWSYEITGDESILRDAVSFAEYFVQPWRPNALRPDGYWGCGSWRDDLGSWVIGPLHYRGFESTNLYGDETSWVFSTVMCIDYITRLYRFKTDPRFLDRCIRATQWTFEKCQFEDGGVGMCGRDDKWLGTTGDAVRQVVMLKPFVGNQPVFQSLLNAAKRSYNYLCDRLPKADIDEHGVEWVTHTTLADPLVNVAALWASALLGVMDGEELKEI